MDQHYDYQAAGHCLESITQERVVRKPESQISVITKETIDTFTVTKTELPSRWRLTLPMSTDAKEIEEVIFRIQGIISTRELPPVYKDRKRQPHEAKFLRQGVQLTGLGAPSFAQSIQTISTLFSIFSRDFPDGMIHRWTPEQFSDYPALNISNRYFYEPRDCHVQDSIALGETVDPDHYLTGLALQAGVIHTEDNRVVYMEKDKRTPDKFIKTNPSSFKIGDIVEAVFSIVVIPVKNKKVQMLLVLRGLSLLDKQHSIAAHAHRVGQITSSSSQTSNLTLKRKACYDEDEEVQDVRKGFRDMSV